MRNHLIVGVAGLAACVLPLAGCPCAEKICQEYRISASSIASAYAFCCDSPDPAACDASFQVWFRQVIDEARRYARDCSRENLELLRDVLDNPPAPIKDKLTQTRTNLTTSFFSSDAVTFVLEMEPTTASSTMSAIEVGGQLYPSVAAGEAIALDGAAAGQPVAVSATPLPVGTPGTAVSTFVVDRAVSYVLGTFLGEPVAFEITKGSLSLSAFKAREDGTLRAVPTALTLRLDEEQFEVRFALDPTASGNEVVIRDDVGTMWVRVDASIYDKTESSELPAGRVWLHLPVVRTATGVAITSDAAGFVTTGDPAAVLMSQVAPAHPLSAPAYHAGENPGVRPPWVDRPVLDDTPCSDDDNDGWRDGLENSLTPFLDLVCDYCNYDCTPTPAAE